VIYNPDDQGIGLPRRPTTGAIMTYSKDIAILNDVEEIVTLADLIQDYEGLTQNLRAAQADGFRLDRISGNYLVLVTEDATVAKKWGAERQGDLAGFFPDAEKLA
jgi:hypothetical protein